MEAKNKIKVHILHSNIVNPQNPISMNVIGSGGTGSHFVKAVSVVNYAMNQLGHAGFDLTLFDHDIVEVPNIGRTIFNLNHVGMNKAVCVINEVNRERGTSWKAVPKRFELSSRKPANITVTCVDSVKARFEISGILAKQAKDHPIGVRNTPLYWMDFGNSRYTGQFIISTLSDIKQPSSKTFRTVKKLKTVTDEFADLLLSSEQNDDSASCSFAEADAKQDVLINLVLANMGASIFKKMLTLGMLTHRGMFLNLETLRTEPIPL